MNQKSYQAYQIMRNRYVSALLLVNLAFFNWSISSARASDVDAIAAFEELRRFSRGSDEFITILNAFWDDKAEPATTEELSTWRTGRCFDFRMRSIFRAGLLFSLGEGGSRLLQLLHGPEEAATSHFDQMSATLRRDIDRETRRLSSRMTSARAAHRTLFAYYSPSGEGPVARQVRRLTIPNRMFFLALSLAALDQVRDGVQLHEGEVLEACFFYAPVDFSR